ncbi:restriction endonuclease subunit S [Nostocales cyanobacterium LEGE 12452]|nr:restriction endonuclease subunit S [Nostocales cyanobacterium LEGE 12452]
MKNNWEKKKIGELCKLSQGLAINVKTKHYLVEKSDLPLLRIKDLKNNTVEQYVDPNNYPKNCLVTEKDLIYTRTGQIGLVFTGRFGILHNNSFKIEPDKSLLREYLFLFLQSESFKNQILKLASRTAQPDITHKIFKEQIIFVPPISEQKRIVAILDEAFEGIDRAIANTENNLTNSRELFESYRNSILTQNNKEWKETTLGAEIDLMTGFPFKSSGYTDSDQSIRLLRGDNIVQGALRWDDVKKWPESEINEYLSYQLKEGDVVLAMDRPWVKAGLKHAMISSDDLPCLLVQRTACLRGNKNINNRFLIYLIGSHSFIQHILSNQTGIGVPHISGKQIQSFKFLKPFLSEQNFISDSLDDLRSKSQRLETIYRQKLAALNELKQSILQKAFTGELTADTPNQVRKTAKEGIAA